MGNSYPIEGLVGRITPAGDISLFSLPHPDTTEPGVIIAGPDGNLWFTATTESGTDQQGGNIDRITPGGQITEFPVTPDSSSSQGILAGIAAGSDGDIWFTSYGGQLGKITPSGQATFYAPTGATNLGAITEGPDGRMWYLTWGAGQVHSINNDGSQLQTYTYDSPFVPDFNASGLTFGPDGALWINEGRAIGRFDPSLAQPDPTLPQPPTTSPGSQPPSVAPAPEPNPVPSPVPEPSPSDRPVGPGPLGLPAPLFNPTPTVVRIPTTGYQPRVGLSAPARWHSLLPAHTIRATSRVTGLSKQAFDQLRSLAHRVHAVPHPTGALAHLGIAENLFMRRAPRHH